MGFLTSFCTSYLMSTFTFLPLLTEAAFITERIAFAILPCLPITIPISSATPPLQARVFAFCKKKTKPLSMLLPGKSKRLSFPSPLFFHKHILRIWGLKFKRTPAILAGVLSSASFLFHGNYFGYVNNFVLRNFNSKPCILYIGCTDTGNFRF